MEIGDRDAVFGCTPQRPEVNGSDIYGVAELLEGSLGFGIEFGFFGGEGDASFPVCANL